jgi:hypothetical protein
MSNFCTLPAGIENPAPAGIENPADSGNLRRSYGYVETYSDPIHHHQRTKPLHVVAIKEQKFIVVEPERAACVLLSAC